MDLLEANWSSLVEADANTIFSKIEKLFSENDIPWDNLVGFGSDGAPVMSSKNHSVAKKLKERIPNLFIIHCLSHCVHLAASKCAKTFPKEVDYLINQIW